MTLRILLTGILLGAVCPAAPLRGDEALLQDGRRLPGALALTAGRLQFTPTGSRRPLDLAQLRYVRLAGAPAPPFRVGCVRRVYLPAGQQITGQFLALDEKTLTLRTTFADPLVIPRGAATALTQLPGWLPLFEDDFTSGLSAWAVHGKPTLEGGLARPSGNVPRSVVLSQPGQSLACTPGIPVPAGRVGINFRTTGSVEAARWLLEAQFDGKKGPHVIRVTVAGPGDHYEVDAGPLSGTVLRMPHSPGWHRLRVQFTPGSLRVVCDDAALWYNLQQGPGGSLRQLTLRCEALSNPSVSTGHPVSGAVAWGEVVLERALPPLPHPPGDPEQDELRLADGDQLFGQLLQADRRSLLLESTFGKRSFPWSGVRGCYFRGEPRPARPLDGERVRLWIDAGLAADPDVLDGVVQRLDEHQVILRHALFGEVRLDRARVLRLGPVVSH